MRGPSAGGAHAPERIANGGNISEGVHTPAMIVKGEVSPRGRVPTRPSERFAERECGGFHTPRWRAHAGC